jgi:hypothetical protein
MKETSEMTTKELLAEFNERTGKKVTKFSTRAAGIRQVEAARSGALGKRPKAPAEPNTPAAPPTPAQEAKTKKKRAIAQREAWGDRKVAAARSVKHHVAVGDHGEFRSVADAFMKLKLPMKAHIKFRKELKAAGKLAFEFGDKKFNFKIVEAAA